MGKGVIDQLLKYYLSDPRFKNDILRSLREFFDRPDLKPNNEIPLELTDEDEPLLNEWLLFDFKLSNGKTLLEDFVARNPYKLSPKELQGYADLLDNAYGLYEVEEVKWGEGLRLRNLHTGKRYWAREFKGTFQMGKGEVIAARVGKVGDHYELVGGIVKKMPIALTPESRKFFRKMEGGWDLKSAYRTFGGASGQKQEREYISFNEAKHELERVLQKHLLAQYVSSDGVERWIREDLGSKQAMTGPHLLAGLAQGRTPESLDKALEEILHAYTEFANVCPQKALQGKSPAEKIEEQSQQEEEELPRFSFSVTKFSPGDWGAHVNKGITRMKQRRFQEAMQSLNAAFEELLTQQTTFAEVFRPYANKAICHFALGEWGLGERLLKIALEISPHYDFAQMQMARYREEIGSVPVDRKELSRDPAYRYWRFLKPFRVSFAHALAEPSRITAPKQGRNNPCLCGSGKKFKHCHGKP